MKIKALLFVAIVVIHSGCGNEFHHSSSEQDQSSVHEATSHDQTHGLEFNNGKKWFINEEMQLPIQIINDEIEAFELAQEEDYTALAHILEKEIRALTTSCTMTGKSHDELHKWLLPFIDLVNDLKEAKDEKRSQQIFQEIKISMSTYNSYFQ